MMGNCEPIREFDRITVTRIRAVIGKGREGDPVRETTVWLEDDGTVISYYDPYSGRDANPHPAAADTRPDTP